MTARGDIHPVLVDAAVAVLARDGERPGRTRARNRAGARRRVGQLPGSSSTGTVASLAVLPGGACSALLGAFRLPHPGPAALLVLAGVLLLAGAGVAVRVRAARTARARALALRVTTAVRAAAERELLRRRVAVERAVCRAA
ncbi:hypothetical protein [Pseudonocardia phyllosphaerae]|uniref:hypothetical protein n=1 Tax=Pseudonocardia phyllosphaerae TaxID=3390502 RepID=UPI00397E7F07